ncbi:MAG: hypothetical protein HOP21_11805 [Methylotenera sp.]|nr:hypothetical protein [Methylotenera sp.]
MNIKTNLFVISAISVFLCGCAGDPVALSKIVKDKDAYFNQYFSKQSLSESVIKKIPLDENARVFNNTKLVFETKSTSGDKVVKRKQIWNYSGLGNGLIQIETEFVSNDITTGYNFSLNYKGLNNIKWVFASAATGYSDMPYELKEVNHWDKLGIKVGDISTVDFNWGTVVQIMNYHDGQYKCTLTKVLEANELLPTLSGQARQFDCQTVNNGSISLRSKYAYLVDLGFAIPIELTSADFKTEFNLLEINNP